MNSFKFLGFNPSKEMLLLLKQKLQNTFDLSPSDSSAVTKIEKSEEGFKGEVKIHSLAGKFVARVISKDPIQLIEDLNRKLIEELKAWKKVRLFREPNAFEDPTS